MVSRTSYKKVAKKGRLRKRWSASFSGYGIKAGFNSHSKRSLIPVMKNMIRKSHSPKHLIFENYPSSLHETWYTQQLTSNIPQGTDDQSRIGDTIFLEALKIRAWLSPLNGISAYSDRQLTVRIMLVLSDKEFNINWGSGLGNSDLFLNSSSNPVMLGNVDAKAVTCLYDKTFQHSPKLASTTLSAVENSYDDIVHEVIIPIKKKFEYKSSTTKANSIYGKFKNLYLIQGCHVNGGVVGTTSCLAGAAYSVDLIFRDNE